MHSILIGRIQANLKNGIANPFQVEIRTYKILANHCVYSTKATLAYNVYICRLYHLKAMNYI